MEQIKKIVSKNNVVIYNEHHDKGYMNKKGIIEIEMSSGAKHILDNTSETDISNADYLQVIPTKRTKIKEIFTNIIYDNERLEKLANGKRK